jgi:protein-S-isoprenylcysteine O-methyltransferase Ste14
MTAQIVGIVLWAVSLLSWQVAAVWRSRTVTQTVWWSRAGDQLVYFLFALLLAAPGGLGRLWQAPVAVVAALLVAEAGGFAFAWWARIHLGRLRSAMITLQAGHRLVDTGPYRLVRHPIYTGLLGAAWAFAALSGAPASLLGAIMLTAQMSWKARREEAFLRQQLGAAEYDAYAGRVPMLIPFLPVRRNVGH